MKRALICGAGKIGRGFVGQLLYQSGYELYFLDADVELVDLLNRRGGYRVEIAGRPELGEDIPVAGAFILQPNPALSQLIETTPVIFSCVGAQHITALAEFMQPLLEARRATTSINWFICENASGPAALIGQVLRAGANTALKTFLDKGLGLVETQVLRTGMEGNSTDRLEVRMQDWWSLPADADAISGSPPVIKGLQLRSNFRHELTRKLYTFNGLNGPLAYVGYAKGYRFLHEVAGDPTLADFFETIQQEASHGLIAEFGFDPAEQKIFGAIAWEKYRNPALQDTLVRNGRDTARKLRPDERLVGPACLCLKHGRQPVAYAAAIAAAIQYSGSTDVGTQQVQTCLQEQGIEGVLRRFCQLESSTVLACMVQEAFTAKGFY